MTCAYLLIPKSRKPTQGMQMLTGGRHKKKTGVPACGTPVFYINTVLSISSA